MSNGMIICMWINMTLAVFIFVVSVLNNRSDTLQDENTKMFESLLAVALLLNSTVMVCI